MKLNILIPGKDKINNEISINNKTKEELQTKPESSISAKIFKDYFSRINDKKFKIFHKDIFSKKIKVSDNLNKTLFFEKNLHKFAKEAIFKVSKNYYKIGRAHV